MTRVHTLRREMTVARPRDEVFAFFAEAANLGRITPPELHFRIRTPLPVTMGAGAVIDYTIRVWAIPFRWRTLISVWEPPHRFLDVQLRGPYAMWEHRHEFVETADGTLIRDEVRWALPFGALGGLARPLVTRQLARIFGYREATVRRLFASPPSTGAPRPGAPPGALSGEP